MTVSLVTATTAIVEATIYIVRVTIDMVTTIILVCWGFTKVFVEATKSFSPCTTVWYSSYKLLALCLARLGDEKAKREGQKSQPIISREGSLSGTNVISFVVNAAKFASEKNRGVVSE